MAMVCEVLSHMFKLAFWETLDTHVGVTRVVRRADKLVQLCLQRGTVSVLGILDKKDHQECDDGGPCVDDELPGVGIVENWTHDRPDENGEATKGESGRPSGRMSGRAGQPSEPS